MSLRGHQRQRQQQGGEELAGDVAAHADRRVELAAAARPDAQRRIAVVAQVVDAAAELAQRVDQVADRALVHARHAAAARTRRPAAASAAVSGRIAVPALPRNSARLRRRAAAPPRPVMSQRRRRRARTPQPSARSASSITRVSSESSRSWTVVVPLAQRRQQQHAVGDALGAGQARPCRAAPASGGMSRKAVANMAGPARPITCFGPMRQAARAWLAWPIDRFQRLAVAGLDHQLPCACSAALEQPATAPAARARLASRMSRHIFGSLAAMRVKSRKPGPARRQEVLALRLRRRCRCISAKAIRCGRWLTAAKAASCASGVICSTLPPSASQTSVRACQLRRPACARSA